MIKVILLACYILNAMTNWEPATHHAYYEKPAITDARYAKVALAIAETALDKNQEPLFDGKDGRVKSALVLASIASFESGGFRADVINCEKAGDNGKAWGPFQTHTDKASTCGNLRTAATYALNMANASMKYCSKHPLEFQLAQYATGHCRRLKQDGHMESGIESKRRLMRGLDWYKTHKPIELFEEALTNDIRVSVR